MSDARLLWDLYWPVAALGLVLGFAGGILLFRRRPGETAARRRAWRLGVAILVLGTVGLTAAWHGPLGAAHRFQSRVEQIAQRTLEHYEMTAVDARVESRPLTRGIVLSGPADDFQRGELLRMMNEIPGVASVRWADGARRDFALPLIVLAELIALAGFGLGLVISYLIELRRRARAEWRW